MTFSVTGLQTASPRFSGLFIMSGPVQVRDATPTTTPILQKRNDKKPAIRKRLLTSAKAYLLDGQTKAQADLDEARRQVQAMPLKGVGARIVMAPETRLKRYQHAIALRDNIPNGTNFIRLMLPMDGMPARLGKKHQESPAKRPFFLVEASGVHANNLIAQLSNTILGSTDQRSLATTRAALTGIYPGPEGRITRAHVQAFKDAKTAQPLGLFSTVHDILKQFTSAESLKVGSSGPKVHASVDDSHKLYGKEWAVLEVPAEITPESGPRIFAPIFVPAADANS